MSVRCAYCGGSLRHTATCATANIVLPVIRPDLNPQVSSRDECTCGVYGQKPRLEHAQDCPVRTYRET